MYFHITVCYFFVTFTYFFHLFPCNFGQDTALNKSPDNDDDDDDIHFLIPETLPFTSLFSIFVHSLCFVFAMVSCVYCCLYFLIVW